MKFYLGTHLPNWLERTTVPLFISHRRLKDRRTLPTPLGTWALDSGGFTELSTHGRWVTTPEDYIASVRRYRDEMPGMDWAAPMDWMCEPVMLAKTGLTVQDHQRRTIDNFLLLRQTAPDLPFVPVLQGWDVDDYLRHADAYADAGVDLTAERLVGVGTVCRRQDAPEAARIVFSLADRGLALHGFGFKLTGLGMCGDYLVSADSMAWSFNARKNPPLPGHNHKSCANCFEWAMRWREKALRIEPAPRQLSLMEAM